MIATIPYPDSYDLRFDWPGNSKVAQQNGEFVARSMLQVTGVRADLGNAVRVGADTWCSDPNLRKLDIATCTY